MLKSVSPYIGKYKKYTVLATVLMLLGIVANVCPYIFLYQIICRIVRGEALSARFMLFRALWILVCEVLHAVLYTQGLTFSHKSAYNTLKNIRLSLQGKLEKQPLGNLHDLGTGQIKRVFTDDIDHIELLLAHAIPEGIANIVVPLLVLVATFFVDWHLALLTLAVLPIGLFAMGMMMKCGYAKMADYYDSAKRMNNTIVEYVNGMEVVKVFNKDGDSYRRFGDVVKSYRDFTLAWYKACWPWMAIYSAVLPCFALFTLPVGSLLVLNNVVTLEKLILVLTMSFAIGPSLLKALTFAGKIPQLGYKIAELEKLVQDIPLKQSERSFEGSGHDIAFTDVCFAYKKAGGESSQVLHNVSLSIPQGTVTALVGESGSGKSTLAKLLVHYYDIDSGSITLGGQDITDMSIESLNDQIAYVSQEQFLFNTSLYENILIGNPGATRNQVLDAAHRAQCDEFLRWLPDGIDSNAGDSGKQLSGGERQRISLARALLKNAPVIVLDEATAFMDPENEEKMNAAISEVIQGKTVIVIAHRLSTIKNADAICVMKDGRIIAKGTHQHLLEQSAEYQSLWKNATESGSWKISAGTSGGEAAL